MHEHLTAQDWIRLWGDPDLPGQQLATCPRCTPFREDTEAWLQAVLECSGCRAALEATPLDNPEILNCRECMAAFGKLHDLLDELEHFDPGVASEVLVAEELFGKLVRLSLPDQLARVTDDIRYQQWGLAQRLLHASREDWCDDPERAHDRAAVAVAVADRVDPDTYHPEWVSDLRAKAHAYLANTARILADFAGAEREFLQAEFHLWRGVGSGRTRAEVFSLKASLLIDQSRFVEAAAVLDGVRFYYDEAEDPRALAKTHLKLAMVAAGRGDFQNAAQVCGEAASRLDAARDRRLSILARQNAVHYFVHAGEVDRARGLYDTLPPAEGRSMELRRLWVEGDLLRAEGRHTLAMDAYQQARRGYAELGRFYDMALIALEESLTAFDLDDVTEMQAMAEEASILLVKAAAKHEALAVMRVLLAAMERGLVNRSVIVAIARRIAALKPSS